MLHNKADQILKEAADALEDLSRRLRALSSAVPMGSVLHHNSRVKDTSGNESGGSQSRSAQPDVRAEVAVRIRSFWNGIYLGKQMHVGDATIDLDTPEGKWELLVLAVLIGARVREPVVEQTFSVLKKEGLLERERLIDGDTRTKERLIQLFHTHYKALGNRRAKVEALFWNAAHLEQRWNGNLDELYRDCGDDWNLLIQRLHEFKQIKRVAFWICRTLHAHGIWRGKMARAAWYFDRYSNLPLIRLGFIGESNEPAQPAEIETVLQQWFDEDVVGLYMHGLVLCSQNDVHACLADCPVASWCRFPADEEGQSPK